MKVYLSRRVFTLALAVLIGAAMSPCVLHAQSQSTTTTNSSTSSRAAKRKAKREAKKEAKEKKAAQPNAAAQSSPAASSSSGAAANNEPSAKSASRSHESAASHSATPPAPGMVWVNTSTKVYHSANSKWAGKTKHGKWMSLADAQKSGYKAAKN